MKTKISFHILLLALAAVLLNPIATKAQTTWYRDSDADGFGNNSSTGTNGQSGYVPNNIDPNDNIKHSMGWYTVGTAGAGANAPWTAMTVSGLGTTYIGYISGGQVVVYKKGENSTDWTQAGSAFGTSTVGNFRMAACTNSDKCWVVLQTGASTIQTFLYDPTGNSWSQPAANITSATLPALTIDANDAPFIAYNTTGGNGDMAARRYNAAGTSSTNFTGLASGRAVSSIGMCTDKNGLVYIAAYRSNGTNCYLRRISTSNVVTNLTNFASVACDSIGVASDGTNIYVLFRESGTSPFKGIIRKYDGASWNDLISGGYVTAGAISSRGAIYCSPTTDSLFVAFADGGSSNNGFLKKLTGSTLTTLDQTSTTARSANISGTASVVYWAFKDANNTEKITTKRRGPCRSWVGGSSSTWATTTNWYTGEIPATGDDIVIRKTTNNPSFISTVTFGTVTVDTNNTLTASSGTLTASTLIVNNNGTLTGGGGAVTLTTLTNNGTVTNSGSTITAPTLTNNNSVANNSGTLTVATTFTNDGTVTNSATINGGGALSIGASKSLTCSSNGAVTLGNTTVASGGSIANNGSGTISLGTVGLTGATISNTLSGGYSTSGAISVNSASSVTNSGSGTITAAGLTVTGGVVDNTSNGNYNVTATTTLTSSATLRNQGTGTITTVAINADASAITCSGTAGGFSTGAITLTNGATLSNSNTADIQTGTISSTGCQITNTGGGDYNITGTTTLNSGALLRNTGSGTITTVGINADGGSAVTLNHASGSFSTGAIALTNSATLNNSNTGTFTAGNITSTGCTITNSTTGTLNAGDITLNSGASLVNNSTGTIAATGTVTLNGSSSFSANAGIFNAGALDVNSGTLGINSGTYTITNDADYLGNSVTGNVSVGGNLSTTAAVSNSSTLSVTGSLSSNGAAVSNTSPGTLTAGSIATGGGHLTNNSGTMSLGSTTTTTSGGNVTQTSGTFTTTGGITTSNGTVDVASGNTLTVGGTLSTGTGTITNNSSSTLTIGGISTSGTLNNSGTLNVTGTFTHSGFSVTNTGTINLKGNVSMASNSLTGTVKLNGTSAQSLTTSGTFANLELDNSNGASITNGQTITITGTYTPTTGTLTTNSGLLLKSDVSGTARIAACTTSSTYISGNVTFQRYVPGGRRAYRYFSHPFTSAVALNVITDNIDITGAGGATNGFTPTSTNNASAQWYDPTTGNGSTSVDPGWTVFSSANATTGANSWKQYQGVKILVRGAKNEGLATTNYTPSAVTIDAAGGINMGDQVVTLTKGTNSGYNLVGNPFPSQIDLNLTSRGSNVGANFWVWDPNGGTKGTYSANPFSSTYILPAYSAFFALVSANSNNTITFPESCKLGTAAQTLHKSTAGNTVPDLIELKIQDSANESITWDKIIVRVDSGANLSFDELDARKLLNSEVNFFTYGTASGTSSDTLAIDARPYLNGQKIPTCIWSFVSKPAFINVTKLKMPSGTYLFLDDSLTRTSTLLNQGDKYYFNLITNSNDPLSAHRFTLRFYGNPPKNPTNNNSNGVGNLVKLKATIAPNPATELIKINMEATVAGQTDVRIINMLGQEVFSNSYGTMQSGTIPVEVKHLATGIYNVQIKCGSEVFNTQIVKQ